jgi:hypothetical protein
VLIEEEETRRHKPFALLNLSSGKELLYTTDLLTVAAKDMQHVL